MRSNFFVHEEILNSENPYIRESGVFFANTSLFFILGTFVLGINHCINDSLYAGLINFSVSIFALLNLWFFSKIGELRLAANMLLFFSTHFLLLHFFVSGDYYPFHLVWLPCAPIFATSLLSKKEAITWTVYLGFSILIIYALRHYDLDFTLYEIKDDKLIISSLLSICLSLIISLLLLHYIRRKELNALTAYKMLEQKYALAIDHVFFKYLPNIAEASAITENINFQWNERSEERNSRWLVTQLKALETDIKRWSDNQEHLHIPQDMLEPIDFIQLFERLFSILESKLDQKKIKWEVQVEDNFSGIKGRLLSNPVLLRSLVFYPLISYFTQSSKKFHLIQLRLRAAKEEHISIEIVGTYTKSSVANSTKHETFLELEDTHVVSVLSLFGARLSYSDCTHKNKASDICQESFGILFPVKS